MAGRLDLLIEEQRKGLKEIEGLDRAREEQREKLIESLMRAAVKVSQYFDRPIEIKIEGYGDEPAIYAVDNRRVELKSRG